jgi:hypothetical protein
MTYDTKKKCKKVLTSSAKCAIIFPVSERKTMTEIYGANYAKFVRRTLKVTKHPFIPREEPVSEAFVPRKKSEKKVEKGLDFVPKV